MKFLVIFGYFSIFFFNTNCFAQTISIERIKDSKLHKIAKEVVQNSSDSSTFAKITTLIADNKGIAKLDGLEIFSNLKKLSLKGNIIDNAEVVAKLKKLKALDLSNNVIERASWSTQLSNLQYLDLSNNVIKYGFLLSHENLEELDISFNKIQQLNGVFKKHARLKSLNASNNPINDIPSNFIIPFLKHLDLSCTNISSLENLKALKSLKHLNVSNCQNLKNISTIFNETKYGISCAIQNLESIQITEEVLDESSKAILNKLKSGALNKQFTINNTIISSDSHIQQNKAQKPAPKVFAEVKSK